MCGSRLREAAIGLHFHGMDEVREFDGILDKENWDVVAHQVPVPFLGIELHREAPDVALGVGRAALAGDDGEAHEHIRLLADGREDLRLGVLRDVVRDREGAERARALGVHAPLGDHLAVKVCELLD